MNLNPIISYKESGYKDKAKQNPKRKLPVVRNKEEKKKKNDEHKIRFHPNRQLDLTYHNGCFFSANIYDSDCPFAQDLHVRWEG